MADKDRLLVSFAVEIARAKDAAGGIAAMREYLVGRLSPAAYHLVDHSEEKIKDEKKIIWQEENRLYASLPLPAAQYLVLSDLQRQALDAYEQETFERLVLSFCERYTAFKELKGLTFTDDLTGLYNQRYLELVLDREFAIAKRAGSSFCVLFLDLDHFKLVNDNHGHLVGSRLLNEVGDVIKRTLRESDVTFRYGGDEFVMVLGNTNLSDGMSVAERVRAQIEKKRFFAREKLDIRLTASIGVACFPDHAQGKKDILLAADEALYGVKRKTRNMVEAAVHLPNKLAK